ncbi:hypothetical protein BDN72DRAFT_769361, partial [Pluteus cervinus]
MYSIIYQIDQEIKALEERLLVLRTTRNRLAPISRIPVEIFGKIFLFARDSSMPEPSAGGRIVLAISRVSRHWREMALGDPSLWSRIDFTQLDGVQAFLQRSCNARISFQACEALPTNPAIQLVLQNLARLQELVVLATTASRFDFLILRSRVTWATPAPILEHLTL